MLASPSFRSVHTRRAHPVADGFAVAMGRGLDGLYVEVFLEKPAEERVPA